MARCVAEGLEYTNLIYTSQFTASYIKINIAVKESRPLGIVLMKIPVFRDFTLCHWIRNYRIFEELQYVSEDLNFQLLACLQAVCTCDPPNMKQKCRNTEQRLISFGSNYVNKQYQIKARKPCRCPPRTKVKNVPCHNCSFTYAFVRGRTLFCFKYNAHWYRYVKVNVTFVSSVCSSNIYLCVLHDPPNKQ
jgi:hypothetical protein